MNTFAHQHDYTTEIMYCQVENALKYANILKKMKKIQKMGLTNGFNGCIIANDEGKGVFERLYYPFKGVFSLYFLYVLFGRNTYVLC